MSAKTKKQHSTSLIHDKHGSLSIPVPHPHLPEIKVHTPLAVQTILHWLNALKTEQIIVAIAIFSQVLLAGYLFSFLRPINTAHSYASSNCFNNLVILPSAHTVGSSDSYNISMHGGVSLGLLQLTSTTTCVDFKNLPSPRETAVISPALLPFLEKKINIDSEPLPSIQPLEKTTLMPTNTPFSFEIDKEDNLFEYFLFAGSKKVDCVVRGTTVTCDMDRLELTQSKEYTFELKRYLGGQYFDTAYTIVKKTVEAITVKSSSIKPSQIVYDKPKSFTLTFSKEVESFESVSLKNLGTNEILPTSVTIKDKSLIITTANDLPRQTTFALEVTQAIATDFSSLASPYTLKFSTSGGPKVASVSIATYGVYTSSNINLNFDSAVSSGQNLSNFISISAGGKNISINAYNNGSTVTVDPISNLPKCTSFTIRVTDGISSSYGVIGGSAWSYNSRTICRSEFTIGSSVLGRAILAYKFGSGPSTIIFVGNMHGDEVSAKYTLTTWIDELEAKYGQIPANRTIVVIPSLNPDGLASGNRYNHRGVDLNRNFPDVDWQSDVQVAGGEIIANNGGTSPLSEPEASSLASYIQATSPRLILSYHAVGSFIIANESGDSTSLANKYASLSSYWAPSASQSGELFDYQITGTLEGWAYSILGIPTLVIEQSTYSANEFYSQNSAMWAMVKIP